MSAASVPRWGFASYARGLMMSPSYCASWGWSSIIVIVTLTAKLLPNGPARACAKGVGGSTVRERSLVFGKDNMNVLYIKDTNVRAC